MQKEICIQSEITLDSPEVLTSIQVKVLKPRPVWKFLFLDCPRFYFQIYPWPEFQNVIFLRGRIKKIARALPATL